MKGQGLLESRSYLSRWIVLGLLMALMQPSYAT